MLIAASSGRAARPDNPRCTFVFLHTQGPHETVVGATYTVVSGMSMSEIYGSGQTSSLGIGVSGSGSNGSFSESGTFDTSDTSEQDYPSFSTSKQYKTNYVYGLYEYTCGGFQSQPTSYAGGATTASVSAPEATWCLSHIAGSTFKKFTSSAFTFAGGVNIGSVIGINLSAQTGYDSNAQLIFTFNRAHDLCGTNDFEGGTPKRLVAGLS